MKRWQRVKLTELDQIVTNETEWLPNLERYSPEDDQRGCRRVDIFTYTNLALLHHFQVDNVPGKNGVHFAERAIALSMDYFWGDWRNRYLYQGKKVEIWDAKTCRERLEWFDVYRESIFCASALGDDKALDRLFTWADIDLSHDEGSWYYSQAENDFYILVALTMRGIKPKEQKKLRVQINSARTNRPKLWLEGFDAILENNVSDFLEALEAIFKNHLQKEYRPNNPPRCVMFEGTLLWRLAQRENMKLPELSEHIGDRIVRKESLFGK